MEVGSARERILIALLIYVYDKDSVSIPDATSAETDIFVNGKPISIKTKTGKGYAGVKLKWTVDWDKVDLFVKNYTPSSDLLFVNIIWGQTSGFFLIPLSVQNEVINDLGNDAYVKLPKKRTNPRGVELSTLAMKALLNHADTQLLSIEWQRDKTLMTEYSVYHRWLDYWENSS